MAQAPATPKARRLALRLMAATLGARGADMLGAGMLGTGALRPQPSEIAALAARARPLDPDPGPGPDPGPAPHPEVVFLVPLVGRHHVSDWASVSARLSATVESFRRQTSTAWRALICGQDRPDGLPDTPQVRFLPFTEPVTGNDKWKKLAALAGALAEAGVGRGYAMPFDADDLLAPDVVAAMVAGQRAGYLVTRGLLYDAGQDRWARAEPQSLMRPGQKAFWKLCGSCAAFGFDLRKSAEDAALIGAITAHEHRMFPYLARLAGRPLAPLPGDAALYIVNHGENFGVRRGRVRFKTRFAARFALTDTAEIARASTAFPGVAR